MPTAYDAVTDTWIRKADMPTARGSLSAASVNGKVYAMGGEKTIFAPLSIVEEYDTGFAPKSVKPNDKMATLWGNIKSKT